ncbi:hypothetical protein ACFVYR_19230 [Streptomyces sp. NPDC058284]|uniref:HAAS signaling domain-containing protein n=1 Tax=unclassified Streptomyces TaxID=2593676 RepID=UPI0036576D9A
MGIESDQLVYDYLSRVGDLAQQRQLPSGDRMRLVSELRNRIDRGRATGAGDSPATVRRILARLGTPEEIVEAAGGASGDVPDGAGASDASGSTGAPTGPSVPRPRMPRPRPRQRLQPRAHLRQESDDGPDADGDGAPRRLRRIVPRPRRSTPEPPEPVEFEGASPPHLAGSDELGPSGSEPDWWRVDSSPFGVADSVPGFVGGVEIPEILKPPPSKDDARRRGPRLTKGGPATSDEEEVEDEYEEYEEGEEEEEGAEEAEEPGVGRRRWRFPRGRAATGAGTSTGTGISFNNPLLLLAAALLTVGAVLGNFLALGVGWLIAYTTRRLSRAEAKFAALGLPALSVAAGIGWLWGRGNGRWGEPIADGHMSDAIADTWPWVVRGAAVASALFLLWRSQRQRL